MTTTPKLKPAARSWRMGSDMSSKTSLPSFLNHSVSFFSALIGPCQKSAPTGPPLGAPVPCSCPNACRPRRPMSAGAPKRPNRNHVIPRTPTQAKNASPSVPTTPRCTPCSASSRIEQCEWRGDRPLQGPPDELDSELEQAPDPADEHDEKPHQARPVEPDHAEGVPPRHQQRLEERAGSAQTEGKRVQ